MCYLSINKQEQVNLFSEFEMVQTFLDWHGVYALFLNI